MELACAKCLGEMQHTQSVPNRSASTAPNLFIISSGWLRCKSDDILYYQVEEEYRMPGTFARA